MGLKAILIVVLAALASGCVHRPGVFRLTTATLIPPDAPKAAVTRASIQIGGVPRKTPCSPSPHGLFVERKWLRAPKVVVTEDALKSTSGAELFSWAVGLEKQGCIPGNEAFRLAENVIDSLPLDLAKRRELIRARGDLKPVNSLRVVSPIYKPGVSTDAGEITAITQGGNYSLNVDVRDSHATTGYEIDWYDVSANDAGPGYRIVPRSAEIHIEDKVDHPAVPSANRFQFGPDARWYELYMMTKVSANDFDFVVFSAKTSAELQDDVATFQRSSEEFLQAANPGSYTVLPHGTGINAYIRVKVNGVSVDLPPGNTVRQAIVQAAGDPKTALPGLKVRKLHDGKLYPVEWDRATDQILSLPLEGGEEIDW
jgi:hypothetical protein